MVEIIEEEESAPFLGKGATGGEEEDIEPVEGRNPSATTEESREGEHGEGTEEGPPKVETEEVEVREGVRKQLITEGKGEATPKKHSTCFVHYRAWTAAPLSKIGDTWQESQPEELIIGHEKPFLRGLAAGVSTMRAGERALFHVNWELAYGKTGSFSFPHVPPSSDLIYEVLLVGFEEANEGRSRAEMTVEERIAAADRRKVDGNEFYKEGKTDEAVQQYEMALGYMNEDFMFQMFGKYRDLANAVRLPTLLNLAACALRQGRPQEAIAHCSQVLSEDERNVKALYRRGKARAILGQSDAATEDLIKANKLAPGDKAVLKELQALKEAERLALEKQKLLFQGMFAKPAAPAKKRSWLGVLWDWFRGTLRKLWPFKTLHAKSS